MHNLLKINIVKMAIIDHKIAFLGTKDANSIQSVLKQTFSFPTRESSFLGKIGVEPRKTFAVFFG